MLAWTLLTLPVFAVAFLLVMVLWIFWDAYRDSERTGRRLAVHASRRGHRGVSSPPTTGRAPSTVTCSPPSCRACLTDFRYRRPGAIRSAPMACGHGMWAIRGTWRCGWAPNGTSTCLGPTRSGKTVSVVIPSRGRGSRLRARDLHARRHHQNDPLPARMRREGSAYAAASFGNRGAGHHAHLRSRRRRGERSGHAPQHELDAVAGLRRSGRRRCAARRPWSRSAAWEAAPTTRSGA